MVAENPRQGTDDIAVADAASALVACFDKHQPRLLGEATIKMVRQKTISGTNRRSHEAMPACGNWFLETSFFDGHPTCGIHITQDAILGPDEIRVWIKARVDESNSDAASGKIWVGVDADRRGQELLFVL